MPNIADYAEGEFAKVGISLNEGTKVKFLDAGKIEKSSFSRKNEEKKDTFAITILVNNKKKQASLNSKSTRNLGEAWGMDTANWVGKEAIIHLEERNVFGVIKKVVYYNPLKSKKTEDSLIDANSKATDMAEYLKESKNREELNKRVEQIREDAKNLPMDLQKWLKTIIESKEMSLEE